VRSRFDALNGNLQALLPTSRVTLPTLSSKLTQFTIAWAFTNFPRIVFDNEDGTMHNAKWFSYRFFPLLDLYSGMQTMDMYGL